MNKTFPSFHEEKIFWDQNTHVIGIDEVGRGAFAGPIVASAVIFPINTSFEDNSLLSQVNDSKQIKPQLRGKLFVEIKKSAMFWSISEVDVSIINRKGIGVANKMVFRKVISDVLSKAKNMNPDLKFKLLVDGFHIKYIREIGLKNQKAIVRGDQISYSIASASILAKVHRDEIMKKRDKIYPNYFFAKNKGYGTKNHITALRKFGASPYHRTAFIDSII